MVDVGVSLLKSCSRHSSLPFREAVARLCARGLQADHATFWRWVQHSGLRARRRNPRTPDQRVDETTVRVKGRWCYLSRAINATGTTIDFGQATGPWAQRNLHIERIAEIGRRAWQKETGYRQQARVEGTFLRYKRILGGRHRARGFEAQQREAMMGCTVLNKMLALGKAQSSAVTV